MILSKGRNFLFFTTIMNNVASVVTCQVQVSIT